MTLPALDNSAISKAPRWLKRCCSRRSNQQPRVPWWLRRRESLQTSCDSLLRWTEDLVAVDHANSTLLVYHNLLIYIYIYLYCVLFDTQSSNQDTLQNQAGTPWKIGVGIQLVSPFWCPACFFFCSLGKMNLWPNSSSDHFVRKKRCVDKSENSSCKEGVFGSGEGDAPQILIIHLKAVVVKKQPFSFGELIRWKQILILMCTRTKHLVA